MTWRWLTGMAFGAIFFGVPLGAIIHGWKPWVDDED